MILAKIARHLNNGQEYVPVSESRAARSTIDSLDFEISDESDDHKSRD